jgi:hypothetical protein
MRIGTALALGTAMLAGGAALGIGSEAAVRHGWTDSTWGSTGWGLLGLGGFIGGLGAGIIGAAGPWSLAKAGSDAHADGVVRCAFLGAALLDIAGLTWAALHQVGAPSTAS